MSPVPVALPTLPLSIAQSFSSYSLSNSSSTSSMTDSEMEDVTAEGKSAKVPAGSDVRVQRLLGSERKSVGRIYCPVGVRISSARSCATQSAMTLERGRVASLA